MTLTPVSALGDVMTMLKILGAVIAWLIGVAIIGHVLHVFGGIIGLEHRKER